MAQASGASAQRAAGERRNAAGLTRVEGRGCVLRGDDIDTDRIIPARFLRCVTFDGIGEHAFEDDRLQAKGDHPLDDARFLGANILIVGRNFGCGSSREHAPQSLLRFGFEAFVGASFAEIFAGNCTALGLPCVTLAERDLEALMDSVSLDPSQPLVIDLVARTLSSRAGTVPAGLRDGVRKALLEGSWNATAVLIDAGEAIERTAARLPYASGFAG
jgi:3-isopropylmalate/(R)-2-methylmalate dehydratase small subunit